MTASSAPEPLHRGELMGRGYGLALLLAVGCTRTDKAGDTATDPDYSDVATTGYADTDVDTEGPPAETGTTPEPLRWVSVDAGFVLSCGLLSDERVVCWGSPDLLTTSPPDGFVQISVGGNELCGVRADGTLGCWCAEDPYALQRDVCDKVPGGDDFIEVRTAYGWACAEREDHTLQCWGDSGSPNAAASEPSEPVLDWSIETNYGCAVLVDGTVTCWGDTDVFNLNKEDATTAPPVGPRYVQVAAGRTHGCALDDVGEIHCWGCTQSDQGIDFPHPSAGPWASVTAWNAFACGLRADGSAECWHDLPGVVNEEWFIPDEKWASLGLGEWDSCGITVDGRGVCFPEPFDSLGEQDIPDLADLVLVE